MSVQGSADQRVRHGIEWHVGASLRGWFPLAVRGPEGEGSVLLVVVAFS